MGQFSFLLSFHNFFSRTLLVWTEAVGDLLSPGLVACAPEVLLEAAELLLVRHLAHLGRVAAHLAHLRGEELAALLLAAALLLCAHRGLVVDKACVCVYRAWCPAGLLLLPRGEVVVLGPRQRRRVVVLHERAPEVCLGAVVRERLRVHVPHVAQPRVELGPHARAVCVLQHAVLAPLRPSARVLLLLVLLVVVVVMMTIFVLVFVVLLVLVRFLGFWRVRTVAVLAVVPVSMP